MSKKYNIEKPKLVDYISRNFLIAFSLTVTVFLFYVLTTKYLDFKSEIESLELKYEKNLKDSLEREAKRAIDILHIERDNAINNSQKITKNSADIVYFMLENMCNNSTIDKDSDIYTKIRCLKNNLDFLKKNPLSKNMEILIYNRDGRVLFSSNDESLEDGLTLKDSLGDSYILHELNLVNRVGEGHIPRVLKDSRGVEYLGYSYVKIFKKLDIVISVYDYIDELDIIKSLKDIKFDNSGHLAVFYQDGNPMLLNNVLFLKNSKNKLDKRVASNIEDFKISNIGKYIELEDERLIYLINFGFFDIFVGASVDIGHFNSYIDEKIDEIKSIREREAAEIALLFIFIVSLVWFYFLKIFHKIKNDLDIAKKDNFEPEDFNFYELYDISMKSINTNYDNRCKVDSYSRPIIEEFADMLPYPFFQISLEGRFHYANDYFLSLTDVSFEELIEYRKDHNNGRYRVIDLVFQKIDSVGTNEILDLESEILNMQSHKNKKHKSFIIYKKSIDIGNIGYIIGFMQDISDIRVTNEKLRKCNDELYEAKGLISHLTSIVQNREA